MSPVEIALVGIYTLTLLVCVGLLLIMNKMMDQNREINTKFDILDDEYNSLRETHEKTVELYQTLQVDHHILEGQRDDAYKNLTMVLSAADEPENTLEKDSDEFAKFSNTMRKFAGMKRPSPVDTPLDSMAMNALSEYQNHRTHFSIDVDGTITDNTTGDVLVKPEDYDEKEDTINDQEGS